MYLRKFKKKEDAISYKEKLSKINLSRGNGFEGELITENLKTISDIPKILRSKSCPDDIDIRVEVFIENKDFNM